MLREIHLLMENNRVLSKLVPLIYTPPVREMRSVYLMNQQKKEFQSFYQINRERFHILEEMLEDDLSRDTLRTVIRYRTCPSYGMLKKVAVGHQYFLDELFKPFDEEVFIDGGAYIGETIKNLSQWAGENSWKKVYCWEPDELNRRKLIENCKAYKNIEFIPYGLWSENTELRFETGGGRGSQITKTGKDTIQVNCIDNVCKNEKVTYIKMDVEGSELQALYGAKKVICRDKPRLGICIYHKPEDLLEIPMLIKEMVPEYKLYIRHHSPHWNETVVYAQIG